VAFVGRSNVGKSSILNCLIGRRSLAQTSKTPGKTRACNLYDVAGQYYLVDLPGYGYAQVAKTARHGFAKLIRSYLSHRQMLAGVVWLLDIRREPTRDDLDLQSLLVQRGVPALVVITKVDKVSRGQRRQRSDAILATIDVPREQCVLTSARNKEGIVELRDAVATLLHDWHADPVGD
jgi:GTP-binding protein